MRTSTFRIFIFSTIALFLSVYFFYVFERYKSNSWNRQDHANIKLSKKDNNTQAISYSACNMDTVSLLIPQKTIKKFDSVVDSLINTKTKLLRLSHYFFNTKDPFTEILMPKMKYSKGALNSIQGNNSIKLKLTGGQADHFNSQKRSLRIKSKNKIIGNSNKINFYNPKCRLGGIYEWFNIELLKASGLIGLNSGYCSIEINELSKGVYFYQEQPTQKTLQENNRNKGVIVRTLYINDSLYIDNFYDEKSLNNELFIREKNILQKKIDSFNNGSIDVFDLYSSSHLAKYFAVIDVVNGYHAAELRNMYFYFNPDNHKLEPIGREFSTNYYFYIKYWKSFLSPYEINQYSLSKKWMENIFNTKLLDNINFKEKYLEHLNTICDKPYLEAAYNRLEEEIINKQKCLSLSNPTILPFDIKHYSKNRRLIKNHLKSDLN